MHLRARVRSRVRARASVRRARKVGAVAPSGGYPVPDHARATLSGCRLARRLQGARGSERTRVPAAVRTSSRGASRTAAGSAAGGSASRARRAPPRPDRHPDRQRLCGSNRHPARCLVHPAGCGARASRPYRPQPVRVHSHRRSCTLPPTRSRCRGWDAAPARSCVEPSSCAAHVCRSSERRGWSERAAASKAAGVVGEAGTDGAKNTGRNFLTVFPNPRLKQVGTPVQRPTGQCSLYLNPSRCRRRSWWAPSWARPWARRRRTPCAPSS